MRIFKSLKRINNLCVIWKMRFDDCRKLNTFTTMVSHLKHLKFAVNSICVFIFTCLRIPIPHFKCQQTCLCFFFQKDDVDYHNDCISKKTLAQLSSDVAKLKAKGGMDALNKSKLTLLINFAMRNVDVSKNLSAGPVST